MGFEARQAPSSTSSTGDRRPQGKGPRDRLRPQRARGRVAAEEARQAPEDHHRRQRRPRRARFGRDEGGRRARRSPRATDNVRRQHMLNLQHNKMFVVDGPKGKTVACGSTNFSWRGFYVQNNNALVLRGSDRRGRVPRGFRGLLARTADEPSATRPRRTGRTSACRVSTPGSRSHRTPPRTRCSRPSPTTSRSTRLRRCSTRSRSCTRRPARFGRDQVRDSQRD